MKAEYYTNAKEHVMSLRVFRTLKERDVTKVIGPLFKEPKEKKK